MDLNINIYQNVIQNIEDAENRENRRYFDPEDAFELSDNQFIKIFRLRKDDVTNLAALIGPFMPNTQRNTALTVRRKLLAALRFMAGGSYQLDIGKNFAIGFSQASVSRSLRQVVDVLNRPKILNRYIHFPNNRQELVDARQRFFNKFGLPGIVGCVDGTHVAIIPPSQNEHLYMNRKRYHSLNCQMICDEEMKIIHVNSRHPGSSHDSYVLQQSAVSDFLRNLPMEDAGSFFLLGDSGYPLRPWIITPVTPEPPQNTPEYRFNTRHRFVRSIIEQCFGRLKSRFRCLLRHRVLHYTPINAGKIVNACSVLHNICEAHNVPIYNDLDMDNEVENHYINEPEEIEVPNINRQGAEQHLAEGRRIRQRIINNYFNNNL